MRIGSFEMDDLFALIGGVIVVGAIGGGYELYTKNQQELARIELEQARITAGIEPQTRDVIGRGGAETFIEVDGQKWYSSIDDVAVEETYK